MLADSHLLFRRGLRTLLEAESDLEVVDEASTAAEARSKIHQSSPQVVVMDLDLLERGDAHTVFAMRQANPSLAILFLTQEDGPEHLAHAVEAGARGYMLKSSSPAELVAGIRQVAFNDHHPSGLSRIVPDLRALAVSNESSKARASVLTSREQEVMRLLAEGRTVREVASELSLSVKTVEAHKANAMRKLELTGRIDIVKYAILQGWLDTA